MGFIAKLILDNIIENDIKEEIAKLTDDEVRAALLKARMKIIDMENNAGKYINDLNNRHEFELAKARGEI
jgi:hypothetical protein